MKKIIITEEQLEFIKDNKSYTENNSYEVFNKEARKFIYCIIKDEKDNISDYWRINGIKKGDFARYLKKFDVINELDGGEIIVPKKNFDKKIKRIYYEIFGDEEPGLIMTEDEGGMAGGTSCSSVGGSYEVPVFGLQRRKIASV